jgi:hypothetical protein
MDPDQVGRAAQIIVVALAMGVIVFASIAIGIRWGKAPENPFLAYFAAGFAAIVLPIDWASLKFTAATQLRSAAAQIQEDQRRALAGLYTSRTIFRCAPIEGAAFFNIIAYIVSGQLWSLGIVAVLLVLILVPFPSQTDFENWAEQVRRDLSQ